MSKPENITRRDFLNGTLLTLGSAFLPPMALGKEIEDLIKSDYYPPLLNGLRGSHKGSYETAHALAWTGKKDWGKIKEADNQIYDLVIVGAGISGLSAARFYQQKYGIDKKILILDNHDDFGGHAKRNEFDINGHVQIGYGGSQSMENPSDYSDITKALLNDLGINLRKFEDSYDWDFFKSNNLSSMTFFDKQTYGENQLLPYYFQAAETTPGLPLGFLTAEAAVLKMPLQDEAKEQLFKIFNADNDTLDDIDLINRLKYAEQTLYFDYLKDKLGVSHPQVFKLLRHIVTGGLGSGSDVITVIEALAMGLPGIKPRAIIPLIGDAIKENLITGGDEYIHHFPDGNASIARLLVRKLIPNSASGNTMDDIVLAKFNYNKLDHEDSHVRLRLNSMVVNVAHNFVNKKTENYENKDELKDVSITYIKNNQAYKVRAKNCIMACYNMIIPYLIPALPTHQKEALKKNVKSPLVYTNVVIKNWHAMKKLGVGSAYCPGRMHSFMAMDYPINMGGYQYPTSTDQPMTLHMEYIPLSKKLSMSPIEQFREGRYKLLTMTFDQFESEIKEHLLEMLGPAGFNPEKDIESITVNRWSHGYAYSGNNYFDSEFYEKKFNIIGRQPFGLITIANSDSEARAYMDAAIDQAWRAVNELE